MKKIFKKIIKYTKLWIILLIIFNLSLCITSLFPSKFIEKNVKSSADILLKEGNAYKISEFSSITNNNYTDAIIINEAYSIDNTDPIYSYMSMRKNYKKGETKQVLTDRLGELASVNEEENGETDINTVDDYNPVGELHDFMNGKIDTSITYGRYWHGYMPISRVLLIFFDIMGIRTFLLILFIAMFIYLMYLLKKKIGILTAIIFGYALLMQGYFFVSYSLESSPVFVVMMLSCIILLKRIDKIKNLYGYFFAIGCITNFVDFLTVPLITLAMPLCIYLLAKQKNKKECKDYITITLKSIVIWFIGYMLTWISKWVIYDILYDEGLLESAIIQVIYRTERYNPNSRLELMEELAFFILNNIQYIFILTTTMIIVRLITIFKIKVKLKKMSEYIKENLSFFIISIMPLIWYVLLANHTILHPRFVYRHMLIFLCGILICIKNLFIIQKREKEENMRTPC